MIVLYLIGFLLLSVGIVLILGLTPEKVTIDIMSVVSSEKSLKDTVLLVQGKKRVHKLTKELLKIKTALESTGKGSQFAVACAFAVLLLVFGYIVAVVIGNMFLTPVFGIGFASIPFIYIKSILSTYEKHMSDEMETALSIITTSYIRSDDIVGAVNENIAYLKPPVQGIFRSFVVETTMISSDIKGAIRNLKEKADNDIFAEWCDTLLACQDDRTLMDTLLPIVGKLTDVRIVNNELKTMLSEARNEYWMMVLLVVGNLPILYLLNKSWYQALLYSIPGKIVLAVCGSVILITAIMMGKYTKPMEYRR